jgi:hypothetical protein
MQFFSGLKLSHLAIGIAAVAFPVLTQGCSTDDVTNAAGGCDGLSGSSQDVITVKAYVKAVDDLQASATTVQANWLKICNDLNTAAGQPTATDAGTACDTFHAYLNANASIGVSVDITGGCTVSASAEATCQGSCTANANCDVAASCQGTVEYACSGRCSGTCDGTCDGNQSSGSCSGTCSGQCSAQCDASGQVTCNGTLSCSAAATCNASCQADAQATVDCSNPQITVNITGNDTLNAAYQADVDLIGTSINETAALGTGIAALAGQTADTFSAIGNVGLDATACFASTLSAFTSIQANVSVSVSASASVSGGSS